MSGPETYEAYREQLFARHESRATAALASAGDVLITLGFASALVTRRPRWALRGLGYGLAVGAVAHLFQPGSLRPELAAIRRHPVWSVRAELDRFWSREHSVAT